MATRTNPTSSSAGVLRPEQLARLTRLERYDAAPPLADHVENLWSLRWDLPDGVAPRQPDAAAPACTVSVERGATREGVGQDPVVVTGVVARRFDVALQGSGGVFAAEVPPRRAGRAHRWGRAGVARPDHPGARAAAARGRRAVAGAGPGRPATARV